VINPEKKILCMHYSVYIGKVILDFTLLCKMFSKEKTAMEEWNKEERIKSWTRRVKL
jgi:hypothetical protein